MIRRAVGRLCLALGTLLVVFFVADCAVRMIARSGRGTPAALYGYDPILKANWHIPNSRAIIAGRGTPPHAVSFNAYGYRGPHPDSPGKRAGTTRVIILGESSTEDYYVGDGETWPERLETELNGRLGSNRVEVINMACSGYTLTTSVRNLELRGLALQPDVVIICHGNNDFWKWFCSLEGVQWAETHVDYERRQTTGFSRLACRSILIDRLNRFVYYSRGQRNRDWLQQYMDTPSDQKVRVGLSGVEAHTVSALERARELSVRHGFRIVVLIQPTLIKAHLPEDELWSMWEVLRWKYRDQLIDWHTFAEGQARVRRAQRAFCESNAIPCLDMEAMVAKSTNHFIDHIHFSTRGSEAMAGACAGKLMEAGIF